MKFYGKRYKILFDKEGDYLEVIFGQKAEYYKETDNNTVMEKIDKEGECYKIFDFKS